MPGGVDIRAVGRQVVQLGAGQFDGAWMPTSVCEPKLSMTTMSPGRTSETSICWTHARSATPLTGPSSAKGAISPAVRNAQKNVVVFQCPQGALPRQRVPFKEHPRIGVMVVVAQVSSRNTRRSAAQDFVHRADADADALRRLCPFTQRLERLVGLDRHLGDQRQLVLRSAEK